MHAPGPSLPPPPPASWAPPQGAMAGWYPDPYGHPLNRFFDGSRWTHHVVPVVPVVSWRPPNPEHPTLPLGVGIGAVVILAASLIASRPLLERLIDRDWPIVALMATSVIVGYGPSIAWMWFASKRWGTGRVLVDLGVRFRWTDLGWGPVVWVSCLVGMGVMVTVIEAVGIPYRGNLDLGTVADLNRTAVISLVVSAVIVAPVVEEAIFRGAVMRGLLSSMPAVPAIGLQGLLFGAAHFNPDFGVDSIGLVLVLAVTGIGFGIAAYLLRRIGPTIIAHAILNGVAVTVALVVAS